MKRCVILSACETSTELAALLCPDDYIIACDAGYRNAVRLGVQPDVVVGDFDSAPPPNRDDLIVLPRVKDDTDTQYAAALAVQKGFDRVLMLGALGGKRMEHTLANLGTGLYLEKHGVCAALADEYSYVQYLLPGRELCLTRENWAYFSVFPLEGSLSGVSIRGAAYPLNDAQLRADYPLGVSNAFAQDTVQICCKEGFGVVILSRKD